MRAEIVSMRAERHAVASDLMRAEMCRAERPAVASYPMRAENVC